MDDTAGNKLTTGLEKNVKMELIAPMMETKNKLPKAGNNLAVVNTTSAINNTLKIIKPTALIATALPR